METLNFLNHFLNNSELKKLYREPRQKYSQTYRPIEQLVRHKQPASQTDRQILTAYSFGG